MSDPTEGFQIVLIDDDVLIREQILWIVEKLEDNFLLLDRADLYLFENVFLSHCMKLISPSVIFLDFCVFGRMPIR